MKHNFSLILYQSIILLVQQLLSDSLEKYALNLLIYLILLLILKLTLAVLFKQLSMFIMSISSGSKEERTILYFHYPPFGRTKIRSKFDLKGLFGKNSISKTKTSSE